MELDLLIRVSSVVRAILVKKRQNSGFIGPSSSAGQYEQHFISPYMTVFLFFVRTYVCRGVPLAGMFIEDIWLGCPPGALLVWMCRVSVLKGPLCS